MPQTLEELLNPKIPVPPIKEPEPPSLESLLGQASPEKKKEHELVFLRNLAGAVQGVETAVANAPGFKQAGEAQKALANAPVIRDIGNAISGVVSPVVKTALGTPAGKILVDWVERNPSSAKDLGILLNAGINVAALVPIIGTGVKAAALVSALARSVGKGATKETLESAAASTLKTVVKDVGTPIGTTREELVKGTTGHPSVPESLSSVKGDTVHTVRPTDTLQTAIEESKRQGSKDSFEAALKGARLRSTKLESEKTKEISSSKLPKKLFRVKTDGSLEPPKPIGKSEAIHQIDVPGLVQADAEKNSARVMSQSLRRGAESRAIKGGAGREFSLPRWRLRDFGVAGRAIIRMGHLVDTANNKSGAWLKSIVNELPRLSEKQGWDLADVLEGKISEVAADTEVQQWAQTWRPILQDMLPENWKRAGIMAATGEELTPLDLYSPHTLNHREFDRIMRLRDNDPLRQKVIQSTMEMNRLSRNETLAALGALRTHYGAVKRSFEYARKVRSLPREIQLNPRESLARHFMAVMREVNRSTYLGFKNELIEEQLTTIAREFGSNEGQWARKATEMLRGHPQVSDVWAMRAVDAAANFALPTLASPSWHIKHLMQLTNAIPITGIRRMLPQGIPAFRVSAGEVLKGAADRLPWLGQIPDKAAEWLMGGEGQAQIRRLAPYIQRADLMSIYEVGADTTGSLRGVSRSLTNVLTMGLPRTYRTLKLIAAGAGEELGKDALQVIKTGKPMGALTVEKAKKLFEMSAVPDIEKVLGTGQGIQEAIEHFGTFIAEDTMFGSTSLSASIFAATPIGRATLLLRQYATREAAWFIDQFRREFTPAMIPVLAETIAIKMGGGFATTSTINAVKSALLAASRGAFGSTLEEYKQIYAAQEPTTAMWIYDSFLTGFAMLPLELLTNAPRYARSPSELAKEYQEGLAPIGLGRPAGVAAGVIFPVSQFIQAGAPIEELPTLGVAIARNELAAALPSMFAKPAEQELENWWESIRP